MKMRLTVNPFGNATLSYDSHAWYAEEEERVIRWFTCPPDGGYVREWRHGEWQQVCDRLSGMGSTLSCRSREALPDLIRREYRAMRREERREARNADIWR